MKDYLINIFHSEQDGGYIADIPDLKDCYGFGHTPAEALAAVEIAKEKWLKDAAADEIPDPHYLPEIYASNYASKKAFINTNPLPAKTVSADQRSYDDDLKYIAEKVARHQCILFLGSAIHAPPPPDLSQYDYPKEKAPPIGIELSKLLAEKSEYKSPDWWNLQRVAQHFEFKTKSRFRLVEEIGNAIHTDREPSPMLRLLADLEFPIVVTTNYDRLYEQAVEQRNQTKKSSGSQAENSSSTPAEPPPTSDGEQSSDSPFQLSIYSPNLEKKHETVDCPRNPDFQKPFILKIHGDLSRPESIVITDEDYIQFVLRMSDKPPNHPFGTNLLRYLVTWPTLFIGYSLMDYNLRLLFKTLRWKLDAAQIPPSYSVDKKPDELIRDVWESQRRYVSFIVLNLWDFIPKLHSLVPTPVSTPAKE